MDRRAKPPRGKIEAERPLTGKSPTDEGLKVRDVEKRLADALGQLQTRNRELVEAQEQQAATSEILRVMSGSQTDEQPVFDAIVRSAVRLFDARGASVIKLVGETQHLVANHAVSREWLEVARRSYPRPLQPNSVSGLALLERRIVHIPDLETDERFPRAQQLARTMGYRSLVFVPMLNEGAPIGTISVARDDPFSEREIELLKTFADQAVIAIENVRLFTELETRNRDLTEAHAQVTEALEQQTATSEILRVISQSQTDVQPVFDTIVRNARRLCRAAYGGVYRFDGELVHSVAHDGFTPEQLEQWRRTYPRPLSAGGAGERAISTRSVVRSNDLESDYGLHISDEAGKNIRARGIRSLLSVPMFRQGEVIGVLSVADQQAGAFSDAHIEMLKTFADQAVIAIENVRLFTELQEKNGELTGALAQQTATGKILQVISSSPTDVQPVFDAIVRSATVLCEGFFAVVFLFDGTTVRLAAHHNLRHEALDLLRSRYPARPTSTQATGRAIIEGRVVQVADYQNDPVFQAGDLIHALRLRTHVSVPLWREGQVIGVINVGRSEVRPFTDKQVALLQTFADQAVIAIENVRLFTELQASNRELTTALDTQTATSDILRVISRSQRDVQPVFDAILASAVRLLGAYVGALTRVTGDQIELAAMTSTDDAVVAMAKSLYPQPLHSAGAHAQTIRARAPLNIADAYTDPRLSESAHAYAQFRGYRSWVTVPMLRHDEAIGTIAVTRRELGGFTDDEIALLQTFADQAVIAIENARLLSELQARTQELTRSVEQLMALGDVGRAVSSSLDLDTVLTTIVGRAVQLSGTDGGTIFEYDEGTEEFSPRATVNADEGQSTILRATRLRRGEGAVGQMAVTRTPIQIPDIAAEGAYESRLRGALLEAGTRAVLAIPLLHEERIVGGLVVTRRTPGAFTPEVIEILKTFATQSALAIQNARLFHEIEDKSRQLEVASQHKSEFLANMSHELRTPLNAIIGFSEVLTERMFGELNEKQDEYLKDIYASGQHLLSLINDILDLSKIEAGRMELEPADFDLPSAIDNALTLVRERASRRGIALGRAIGERVGTIRADERKVKQVLLNLLSNALKFTPEGGRIDVRAAVSDGTVEVSVGDTGVGIAPEDQEAVFEEFRQVGTADKKVEGTGLGLALSRKFIELHGGRIWVKSRVGEGSTFTFKLPVRRDD